MTDDSESTTKVIDLSGRTPESRRVLERVLGLQEGALDCDWAEDLADEWERRQRSIIGQTRLMSWGEYGNDKAGT